MLLVMSLCLGGIFGQGAVRADDIPVGVYRWPNGTGNVDRFADWLGRDLVWGEDFIGSESWSNVGWPVWWLEAWSKWVHEKPGRKFIFAVPMLPGPVDCSGPTQGNVGVGVPVSLRQGAAGDYNINFQQLAENLVKYKLAEHTILRPGWEFNGNWYTWQAAGHEQEFAGYWRQIVDTMRNVPGTEKLQFCWNPTLGAQQFPAEQAWPGNAYVDLVGVDVYDECWKENTYPWPKDATEEQIAARQKKIWDEEIYGGDHGLIFWSRFAAEHKKPLAICEWGLKIRDGGHGGMDNPLFVREMHRFIHDPTRHVAFHVYFDVDVNMAEGLHQVSPGEQGTHQTVFPRSAAVFRKLFGSAGKETP